MSSLEMFWGFLYSFVRPAPFYPPARYTHTHLYSFSREPAGRPASIVRTLRSIVRTLRLSRNTIGRPEFKLPSDDFLKRLPSICVGFSTFCYWRRQESCVFKRVAVAGR